MINHTATPWELVELAQPMGGVLGKFVIRAKEAPGGIAVTIGGLGEEERVNANLFLAAPEMYKALRKLREQSNAWNSTCLDRSCKDPNCIAQKLADAALAKAEGRS